MIRLGLVGYGKMGRIHGDAISRRSDCALSWIIDPNGGSYDRAVPGLPGVDAVIVASPTPTHSYYASLFAPKVPVLVEKPLTETLSCALALTHLPVFVSQPLRYSVPRAPKPSLFIRFCNGTVKTHGHALFNLAVHDIDLAMFWGHTLSTNVGSIVEPDGYNVGLGRLEFTGGYSEQEERGLFLYDGTFREEMRSKTAISDQLDDFLCYYQTGRTPERLCTSKQAFSVLSLLHAVNHVDSGGSP